MQEILKAFGMTAPVLSQMQISGGRIHETYRIRTESGDYIVQKLHPTAFPYPESLMRKLVSVTDYLRNNFPACSTLHFYPTKNGAYVYNGWRVMDCIPGVTRSSADPETVRAIGKAFGEFQAMLCDFRPDDPEPPFHEPVRHFDALSAAAAADPCGRFAAAREIFDRLTALRERACSLRNAGLPERIVHNDAKLANILFDPENEHPPTVIDLDTVGRGAAAYDFGDAVRSLHGAAETLNHALLQDFTAGFLEGAPHLTPAEKSSLLSGVVSITAELAARYLADHLTGDRYFRHPDSLARASQLTSLAESIP